MRFSIDVGGELELKLFQAALLYRNSRGNRYMATVHNVIQSETGGAPSLGPGQLLSMAGLRELARQLGTGCPIEFLPERSGPNARYAGVVDTGSKADYVFPREI